METLRDILDAAAQGVFPPADGATTVVPQHAHRDAGVLAFTAHSVTGSPALRWRAAEASARPRP